MSRYIDADYVNAFPIRIDHYDEEHGNRHFVLGIESVMEYIEEAPSIDIEPKRGEWIEFDTKWGRSLYYCTNCMETSEVPTALGKPLYNFCPNCGADMRKESE